MSDVMMFDIAKMPYELAMEDELSRRQFYANTQRLIAALEAALARLVERQGACGHLRDFATGKLRHVYRGGCPDQVNGPDARDPACPACQAIEAARFGSDAGTIRELLAERAQLAAENARLREALKDIRSLSFINPAMQPNPLTLTAMLGDIHQIADAAIDEAMKKEASVEEDGTGEQSMNMINDGGPETPVWELTGFGADLRDCFAAKAMAALIAEPVNEGRAGSAWHWTSQLRTHTQMSGPDIIAHAAYMMADAMLKAREASNG